MSSRVPAKLYRSAIYASQFVLSVENVDRISESLPKLLSSLNITNESLRINIIESTRNFINDFRFLYATLTEQAQINTRTSRLFIRHFVVIFGVLASGVAYRKLFTHWRTPLKSAVTLVELKPSALSATSVSLLLTTLPLFRSQVKNDTLSSLLHSLVSLSILPEGYPKDYATVYTAVQSIDQQLRPLGLGRYYWLLLPLSFSEIVKLLTVSPDYVPNLYKKVLGYLYSGFVEKKPIYYLQDWPKPLEFFVNLHQATRVNKTLLYREITLTNVNPSHTNAKLSVLNPSNASLKNILLTKSPRKLAELLVITLPVFTLINYLKSKWSNDPEEKFEWRATLQKSLKSSFKLSLTTLLTIITSYSLLITKLPTRLNGFISGLWFYIYKDTMSPYFATLVARIALLATFRQHRDRLAKHGYWGSLAGSSSATVVGALSLLKLYKLDSNNQLFGRMWQYVQYIKRGGEQH